MSIAPSSEVEGSEGAGNKSYIRHSTSYGTSGSLASAVIAEVFLQIFLQLQIFCVKRPEGPILVFGRLRLRRLDGQVTRPDTRGPAYCQLLCEYLPK
jgi:hypothetical protein